jgi:hypothetical protein
MGIARRKAGTVVRCPTCSGEVVVPTAEASTSQGDSSAPQKPAPVLFEHQDFDQLFGPTTGEPRREKPASTPRKVPVSDGSPVEAAPLDLEMLTDPREPAELLPAPPPAGILLSPLVGVLLGVFVLILVALAFVAGYLVGGNAV